MDMVTTSAAAARTRAQAYGALAIAFHAPLPDRPPAPPAACIRALRESGAALPADRFEAMEQAAGEFPDEERRQDFNDLFMVPGSKYTAPYESVYRDGPIETNNRVTSRTYGPSTLGVMAFYDRVGLQVSSGYTELPDYVGLEMACAEYLCTREAECLEAGQEPEALRVRALERSFVMDHLVHWIPALSSKIREKADTEYFRTLADAVHAWISREAETLCAEA